MIRIIKSLRARLALARRVFMNPNCLIYDRDIYRHARFSFSQEGEDLILEEVIGREEQGFYVDVGCYQPYRFSNTFRFYERGWRGLNIDAMPGALDAFRAARPRDINVECPVSDTEENLVFYVFNERGLNSFDRDLSEARISEGRFKLERKIPLRTRTLASLLGEHLPAGQKISFLSVDVEGYDLKVLRSNDWKKYRPGVILAECLPHEAAAPRSDSVRAFLESLDYRMVARTTRTLFFQAAG